MKDMNSPNVPPLKISASECLTCRIMYGKKNKTIAVPPISDNKPIDMIRPKNSATHIQTIFFVIQFFRWADYHIKCNSKK